MAEIKFKGVVDKALTHVRLLKVASRAAITKGDILVLDGLAGASGSGYVTPWNAVGDAPFAVALEDCANPAADGGAEVLAALITDGLLVRVTATGIAQTHVGLFCNINGAQSIDVTRGSRAQALVIEAETAYSTAIVSLRMTPTTDTYTNQVVS